MTESGGHYNPAIDKLIQSGDIKDALHEPWFKRPASDKRLRQLLTPATDNAAEDEAYLALTLGDVLYHGSQIDPDVLKGVNFASGSGLHDVLSFAYFSGRHEDLIGKSLDGSTGRFQGYVAERMVAHHLIEQGHDVTFPSGPTEPGIDMWVDGHPFQVKCLSNAQGVHEHFARYDFPVITNADLAEQLHGTPNVYIDADLWHDRVHDVTVGSLEQGSDMVDFHPLIGIITSAPLPMYRWYKGGTDVVGAMTTMVTKTTGRLSLGFVGGKAASVAGVLLFGPAGAVVGEVLGSVVGARMGTKLASVARELLTKSEEDALKAGAIALAGEALDSRSGKARAWTEKGGMLADSLTSQAKGGDVIRTYILRRHGDNVAYLNNQATLLDRFRNEAASTDALDAWKRALTLVKRAGIHPHVIQGSLLGLTQLVVDLHSARRRFFVE